MAFPALRKMLLVDALRSFIRAGHKLEELAAAAEFRPSVDTEIEADLQER